MQVSIQRLARVNDRGQVERVWFGVFCCAQQVALFDTEKQADAGAREILRGAGGGVISRGPDWARKFEAVSP